MSIPYGYVYRIRNKINGKTYVGQRKLSLDKKWRQYMGSGVAIKASIVKYGIDNFTKELLSYATSYDELNKLEADLTLLERKTGKAEYNLHVGSPVPQNAGGFKNLTSEEKEVLYQTLTENNKLRYRRKYEDVISIHKEVITSLYAEYRSCAKVSEELQISIKYVNRFLKESGIELNYQTVQGKVLNDDSKKSISNGMKNSTVRFQRECNECSAIFTSKSFNRKDCGECSTETEDRLIVQHDKSLLPRIIANCKICKEEIEFASNRTTKYCSQNCASEARKKELPPITVIERLYWEENFSANEIGALYSLSGQTIRRYMKRNGVDRRERNRS